MAKFAGAMRCQHATSVKKSKIDKTHTNKKQEKMIVSNIKIVVYTI